MEPTYKFKGQKVEVLEKGNGSLWKIRINEDREFWVRKTRIKIKLPPKPKKTKEPIVVEAPAIGAE